MVTKNKIRTNDMKHNERKSYLQFFDEMISPSDLLSLPSDAHGTDLRANYFARYKVMDLEYNYDVWAFENEYLFEEFNASEEKIKEYWIEWNRIRKDLLNRHENTLNKLGYCFKGIERLANWEIRYILNGDLEVNECKNQNWELA